MSRTGNFVKRLINHIHIITFACFLLSLPVNAQPEQAQSTRLESVYEQINFVEKSSPHKRFELAQQYEESTTPELALYLYMQMALQGNSEALFRIGTLHEFELLTSESSTQQSQALVWYKFAAEQDHTEANIAIERLLRTEHEKLRSSQLEEQLEISPIDNSQKVTQATSLLNLQNTQNVVIWIALTFFLVCVVIIQFALTHFRHQPKTVTKVEPSLGEITKSTLSQIAVLKKENQSLKKVNHKLTNKLHINNARTMFGYSLDEPIQVNKLKFRYKKLSKVFHPDNQGSNESMQLLNQAYEFLLKTADDNN